MLVSSFFIIFILSLPLFIQAKRTYVHVREKKSWNDAREYCREHHTDLAVFRDKTEYDALQSPCGPNTWCWIGLYREAKDLSVWQWLNGDKVSFLQWNKGQPDSNKAMCTKLKGKNWYDYACTQQYETLCYDEDKDKQKNDLILVEEKKTWEEALEYCRALQTDSTSDKNRLYNLPHMTAKTASSYARNLIQNAQTQEVWVGLRFLAGHWFWVNGFPLGEQMKKKLPVCPAPMMHCGAMSKTGDQPSLRDCSERRKFFCLQF